MELVKKIKETERQAQEIIQQAKREAARRADEWKEKKTQSLLQAETERRKIIEETIAQARMQAAEEIQSLKGAQESKRQELQNKASARKEAAVRKILENTGRSG
jgi:V/A-type H+-transporting ATPase subunit G/H